MYVLINGSTDNYTRFNFFKFYDYFFVFDSFWKKLNVSEKKNWLMQMVGIQPNF